LVDFFLFLFGRWTGILLSGFVLQVVDTGGKNLEICVLEHGHPLRLLTDEEVTHCTERVAGDKKKEEEEKKKAALKR
jgi:hypothetical protein